MQNKILSIIVPSYNMEAYLPKCLGSLIIDDKDLLQRLDVIVVNDGSKDRTSEIAHEFESKYPGVFRVIDKTNGHYGSCVNSGLGVASGEFVKILDADDWFDTVALAGCLKYLTSVPADVDMALLDYKKVDETGRVLQDCRNIYDDGVISSARFFADVTGRKFYPEMHAIAYRLDVIRKNGYRQTEGEPYTDAEWILYPMAWVKKVACFHCSLYRYLIGREGQSIDPGFMRAVTKKMPHRRLQRMANLYHDNAVARPDAYARYYDFIFECRLYSVYTTCIMRNGELDNEGGVKAFDACLKRQCVEAYERIGAFVISRFGIRFHFVKAWRANASLRIFLFRWLLSI